MTSLQLEDIDFDSFTLIVTEKGNKTRYVPILESAHESLLDWVQNHRPFFLEGEKPSSALWLTRHGRQLGYDSIREICRVTMLDCGLQKAHSGPHLLRHTFATDSLEMGVDIRDLAEVMGHSSISATQIYDHSSKKIVLERFRKAREAGSALSQKEDEL